MLRDEGNDVETNQAHGKREVSSSFPILILHCGISHSPCSRHGIMHHQYSHIRVVLREIDFSLRILQQKSLNQKKKWLLHQHRAEKDYQTSKAKRDEMLRLVKKQEKQEIERKKAVIDRS